MRKKRFFIILGTTVLLIVAAIMFLNRDFAFRKKYIQENYLEENARHVSLFLDSSNGSKIDSVKDNICISIKNDKYEKNGCFFKPFQAVYNKAHNVYYIALYTNVQLEDYYYELYDSEGNLVSHIYNPIYTNGVFVNLIELFFNDSDKINDNKMCVKAINVKTSDFMWITIE